MNASNSFSPRPSALGLDQVLEPLASFICAADRPKAVLSRVFAALLNEVEQTNRLARSQVARRNVSGLQK